MAYKTYITPKVEYVADIWNPRQSYRFETLGTVQNRTTRFSLS